MLRQRRLCSRANLVLTVVLGARRGRLCQGILRRALTWKCFFLTRSLSSATKVRTVIVRWNVFQFHHPSIRSPTATMITSSNSPTFWGGTMPTQKHGLNHDHGMTRAVLYGNPGTAARGPLPSAASSTNALPASAPWPLSPAPDTSHGSNGKFSNCCRALALRNFHFRCTPWFNASACNWFFT
jgi:hypothetical protein